MNKVKFIIFTASVCLAIIFILSRDVQAANSQNTFYGVWAGYVNDIPGFCEINKDAMTITNIQGINVKKTINRIVKWEKNDNDQSYTIYVLTENNQKMSIPIDIDAYSDLKLWNAYEFKKSSQAELGKAVRFAEQAKADEEKTKADIEKAKEKAKVDAKASQSSFTDTRDKKTYKTMKIDNQVWMAQNLNYNAKGSKCYQNQDANCNKYGRLYDWNTAKKSCPSGWHLPSKKEWEALSSYAQPNNGCKNCDVKLLNEFGFSALPGGFVNSYGEFHAVGNNGYWWSASEGESLDSDYAYYRAMYYDEEGVYRYILPKSFLYSVRCLQD